MSSGLFKNNVISKIFIYKLSIYTDSLDTQDASSWTRNSADFTQVSYLPQSYRQP